MADASGVMAVVAIPTFCEYRSAALSIIIVIAAAMVKNLFIFLNLFFQNPFDNERITPNSLKKIA